MKTQLRVKKKETLVPFATYNLSGVKQIVWLIWATFLL